MEAYERKAEFVGKQLNDLLKAIDEEIEGCYYEFKQDPKKSDAPPVCENVIIEMKDGSELKVNISRNSLPAIVRDVMRYVD